jgi:hypothetical protein
MASSLNSRLNIRRCILDLRSGENLNSVSTKPAAAQGDAIAASPLKLRIEGLDCGASAVKAPKRIGRRC